MHVVTPKYGHRFDIDFILHDYSGLEDAFERGDFILVSEFAEDGTELQGMAFVLAGAVEKGIALLSSLTDASPRARLILAFGHWFLGRDDAALDCLDTLAGDEEEMRAAKRLKRLVESKRVDIAQSTLPPPRKGDPEVAELRRVKKQTYGTFTLRNMCTQLASNDEGRPIAQDLSQAIMDLPKKKRPTAVLAMVNHWMAPIGMDKVTIPRVLWNHDEDIFYYRNYDNFRNFDIHLVATSQQHFELSRSIDSFCISNLILDPYCTPYNPPKPGKARKDIDVLFTGAAFDTFLSDKSRFLFKISKLSKDYNIVIVNGRLPEDQYHDAMARTKFLPVISRVLGNPSPRWREILENGGLLLYPAKTMFSKMVKGCAAYGIDDPAGDIRRHLEAYGKGGDAAYNHAAVLDDVRKRFASQICDREVHQERFLKFVAFSAILKGLLKWKQKRPSGWARPPKRRMVWLGSSQDITFFGRNNMLDAVLAQIEKNPPNAEWDDIDYNNMGMVHFRIGQALASGGFGPWKVLVSYGLTPQEHYIEKALLYLDEGLGRFPQSLLLRFNSAQWRFMSVFLAGAQTSPSDSIEKFQTLIEDFDTLSFDPLGSDVGSPELAYSDRVFPYFDYGHIALEFGVALGSPETPSKVTVGSLRDILLAAAHGYIGWAHARDGRVVEACEAINRSLAIYPENQQLLRLKIHVLLIIHNDWRSYEEVPNSGREILETFIDCCNQYPLVLLLGLPRVIDIFADEGDPGELEQLLDDWWWFANSLETSTLKNTISDNHILAIYRHRTYLPAAILQRINAAMKDSRSANSLEIWAARVFKYSYFYRPRLFFLMFMTRLIRYATSYWLLRQVARFVLPERLRTWIWVRFRREEDF